MKIFLLKYYYLIILFICLGCYGSFAQENYNVLPWKASGSFNSWLLWEVHEQYAQRDSSFNLALKSVNGVEKYRLSCKEKYLEILGDLPEKSPLNPVTAGIIMLKGFKVEKIIFESLPNHHITSNLYVPDGKGPFPAVLFFCGHESTAKATESYQQTAKLFVKNGFVVLVIDPISQGERYQLIDSAGKPATRGGTTEHTLLNAGSNLVGTSVAAYELWDNIRSLDYLESRSEVDRNRIGCLGNSGGGTQTSYFIAFDNRIKIAAPCSYVASRERNLELFGASDGCQHIPYEGLNKLEIEDFLIAFAPKPLLILAGRFDFVDYFGVQMVEKDLKKVYSLYNKPNNFKLFTWDDGHGISKPKRENAVTFFRTFFYNDSAKVVEPESEILNPEQLYCSASGQVVNSFPGEITIQNYNLKLANGLQKSREAFLMQSDVFKKKKVSELLGFTDRKLNQTSELVGRVEFEDYYLDKLIVRTENELPIPCLFYSPKVSAVNPEILIILNDEGKAKSAAQFDLFSSHLKNGKIVVLADLSGIGELSDLPQQNDPKYWNKEYRNAMIGLHVGKTVTGQRVKELISIIKFFTTNSNYRASAIQVWANGLNGPVALYAGLFEPSISSIAISSSIDSYFRLLENPLMKDAYSYVLPSVLKYFDIPDIVKWIGVEKVTYMNTNYLKK